MKKNRVDLLLAQLNLKLKFFDFLQVFLIILRALLFSFCLSLLWFWLGENNFFSMVGVFVSSFFSAIILSRHSFHNNIKRKDFIFLLDLKYPEVKEDLYQKDQQVSWHKNWVQAAQTEIKKIIRAERKRTIRLFSTLLLPFVFTFLLSIENEISISTSLGLIKKILSPTTNTLSLSIIDGYKKKENDQIILLPHKNHKIKLLATNLVEINFKKLKDQSDRPFVVLKSPGASEIFQTFQMEQKISDIGYFEEYYSVRFSITQDLELTMPSLYEDHVLVSFSVDKLPNPIVMLSSSEDLTKIWHDEKPLPLEIKVKADYPIDLVNILISIGDKEAKEMVHRVTNNSLTELQTTYNVLLEPYISQDEADVEIVAEVYDKASPVPLVGYSNPLKLKTSSAYGRYRSALKTLRQIKDHLDEAVATKSQVFNEEVKKLIEKSVDFSNQTPFFDNVDRMRIDLFKKMIDDNFLKPQLQNVLSLSQNLNDFLTEHEMLDDRERDRDYFVAVRGLSRVIEQEPEKRKVALESITKNIKSFLEKRQMRWRLRVSYIEDKSQLPTWTEVSVDQPFQRAMETINYLSPIDQGKDRNLALVELSNSINLYRQWIEELEKAEDAQYEKKEQKRQKSLSSARQKLRELQKRQGQISSVLDRSASKKSQEIEQKWPAARMKQNSNIKETRSVSRMLQMLSPLGAQRLSLAEEAMQGTLENGKNKNFTQAESLSDMAGRLLRQALKESQKSSSRRKTKRRKAKGDDYYGQSIHGGDIEIIRDYKVDRRYREDVLDEIQDSSYDQEDKLILDNYLRKVIR